MQPLLKFCRMLMVKMESNEFITTNGTYQFTSIIFRSEFWKSIPTNRTSYDEIIQNTLIFD